jgi:hypothetical protein
MATRSVSEETLYWDSPRSRFGFLISVSQWQSGAVQPRSGVLRHQGELNAVTDEQTDGYEPKLHQLIVDVRTDLGIRDLPFIIGEK